MNEEEIIDKLKRFMEEKAGLDVKDCYFITKKLNEDYWDDINAGEEGDIAEEDDEFSDFDTPSKSKADNDDEIDFDNPESSIIKRPKVKVRE